MHPVSPRRIEVQPPMGHYARLGDYVACIKHHYLGVDVPSSVVRELEGLLATGYRHSVVITETLPENTIDPQSEIDPWFQRLRRAVIYNHDVPNQGMVVIERQVNRITISHE